MMPLFDKAPRLGQSAWVAPNASLIGDVFVGPRSAVWYGAVLRGDVNYIKVGEDTVISDRAVVHVSSGQTQAPAPTNVGNRVFVGPGSILHACTIHDGARIESGALILDGVVVGKNAVITSGSVVPAGKNVGEGEVWSGIPAKMVRKLESNEITENENFVQQALRLAKLHDREWSKTEEEREAEREALNDKKGDSYAPPKAV